MTVWLASAIRTIRDTMDGMVETLRSRCVVLRPVLDERARRLWAAAEARATGRGGIARVAEATGMSRGTVRAGLGELDSGPSAEIPAGQWHSDKDSERSDRKGPALRA